MPLINVLAANYIITSTFNIFKNFNSVYKINNSISKICKDIEVRQKIFSALPAYKKDTKSFLTM